jgi:hypothetical protein
MGGLNRFSPAYLVRCGFAWTLHLSTAVLPLSAFAQAETNSEQIPPLRPPRGEIPPSFWDEHVYTLVIWSSILLIIIGLALWFMLRNRKRLVVPPAVEARLVLEPLLGKVENGAMLSRVSQTLRHYVSAAFGLVPGELTTTEFCEAISSNAKVGQELSQEISQFLRRCDQRKFAPTQGEASSLDAVSHALKFVEASERRCAEIRNAEQKQENQAAPDSQHGKEQRDVSA